MARDPRYTEVYQALASVPGPGAVLRARVLAAFERRGWSFTGAGAAAGCHVQQLTRKLDPSTRQPRQATLADLDSWAQLADADLLEPVLLPGDHAVLVGLAASETCDAEGNVCGGAWVDDPTRRWRLLAQQLIVVDPRGFATCSPSCLRWLDGATTRGVPV